MGGCPTGLGRPPSSQIREQDPSTREPTTKGTLWAGSAAFGLSVGPVLYLFTHTSDDPFVWRSWSFVFQGAGLAALLFVLPAKNRDWKGKAAGLLLYWGKDGEPVRIRTPWEVARTPAFWMTIGFALDLAFWVWAATLIDPLVVTIIFQLAFIGMVWAAARLGRRISSGDRASPHVISGKHWTLMAFSFLGAALVIWSETGEVGALNWQGIAVAVVGTATGVWSLWGTVSVGRLMTWPGDDPNDLAWNSTYSAVAARVIGLPLTLLGSALFFPPTEKTFELSWATVGFLTPHRNFQRGRRPQLPVFDVRDLQFERPADHLLHPGAPDALDLALRRSLHRQPPGPHGGHRDRAPLQPGVPDRI